MSYETNEAIQVVETIQALQTRIQELETRNRELETQNTTLKRAFVSYCKVREKLTEENRSLMSRVYDLSVKIRRHRVQNEHLVDALERRRGINPM